METIVLRPAGPNEKRCIIRHNLGLYSNLAVAAIYSISEDVLPESRIREVDFYVPVVTACVHRHPFLSTAIDNSGSNNPVYINPGHHDLRKHIRVLELNLFSLDHQSDVSISSILELIHNHSAFRFADVGRQPAWAIDIVPLPNQKREGYHSVLISFTYSHSHGDGISGTNFQHTFYNALRNIIHNNSSSTILALEQSAYNFPEQPDTPTSLPITLSYLLKPALGTYLPSFLTRWLGISGNVSGSDDQTWTGSGTFKEKDATGRNVTTSVEIIAIKPETLAQILALCKRKDVKLTALLDEVIAQAFKACLPQSDINKYTKLISTVPVNLRRVLGVSQDTIGNYGGAAYLRYNLDLDSNRSTPFQEQTWASIRTHGQTLAKVSSTSQNQPIGLLRFVSNFPSWLHSQLGQSRDCSWELSNLGSFDPDLDASGGLNSQNATVSIDQMFFSQPASTVGPPIVFNTIATRGGALNLCVTWQPGALGFESGSFGQEDSVASGDGERGFVRRVSSFIRDKFEGLVRSS